MTGDAALWVDPARTDGKVCLTGTRLSAWTVAHRVQHHGSITTTLQHSDLDDTYRRAVLVACWWTATRHPHVEPHPWLHWARDAPQALWHATGPLPPPPPGIDP